MLLKKKKKKNERKTPTIDMTRKESNRVSTQEKKVLFPQQNDTLKSKLQNYLFTAKNCLDLVTTTISPLYFPLQFLLFYSI